jgi:hypothetical protein
MRPLAPDTPAARSPVLASGPEVRCAVALVMALLVRRPSCVVVVRVVGLA